MATTFSSIVSATGPALQGIWIHEPSDPINTQHQYLYDGGLSVENSAVGNNQLMFAGREFPVTEFSENATQSVDVNIIIPWSDTWQAECNTARDYASFRDTLVFRDGRGRLLYGIVESVRLSDRKEGTQVTFTVQRVDYTPQPDILTVMFDSEA